MDTMKGQSVADNTADAIDMEMVEKKAVLSMGGPVRLPEGFEIPFKVSHSTAGPGAGFDTVAIRFGRYRVKKPISYDSGEFDLVVDGDGILSLFKDGDLFLKGVELIPVIRHCPGQAFFNIDPRCEYRCAFCSSPRLGADEVKEMSEARVLEMIGESLSLHSFDSVSFTSGVVGGVDATVERMAGLVRAVRREYPSIRIGVEPYVSSESHLRLLKDAGADEIKLNLQCATDEIFGRVCPDLDRGNIWRMLEAAVGIFGRGNVTSNVIYGFGETDQDVYDVMERLCGIGVIPGLRALRINGINRQSLEESMGRLEKASSDRIIALARKQKEVMARYSLDTRTSRTMCLECGCCDIVPFRDI